MGEEEEEDLLVAWRGGPSCLRRDASTPSPRLRLFTLLSASDGDPSVTPTPVSVRPPWPSTPAANIELFTSGRRDCTAAQDPNSAPCRKVTHRILVSFVPKNARKASERRMRLYIYARQFDVSDGNGRRW